MNIRRPKFYAILFAMTLFLAGCIQSVGIEPTAPSQNADGTENQQSFSEFTDIPIPTGARMNLEKTVVFGAQQGWSGRLSLMTGHNTVTIFDFFKQRMPEFGWKEITTVRAATSFMTYDRAGRLMNIQIHKGETLSLRGTMVDMTVSPKESPAAAQPMAQSPMPQPAVMREPEPRRQNFSR